MKDIYQRTLGETWLAMLREVYRSGEMGGGDARELLQVCASFGHGEFDSDPLLVRFASRENFEQMRKVFFTAEPNRFGNSYRDRIRGPMGRSDLSDVIELLGHEPLSKRAAIVLVGEGDGHVPCINAVHFLRRASGLIATYFARGQDIFRKFYADGACIFEMARRVADAIGAPIDRVTGVISSAHIYLSDLPAIGELLAEAATPQLNSMSVSDRQSNELLTHQTPRLEAGQLRFLRPSPASTARSFLVAIEGPNGAGKTRLWSLLAPALGARALRGVPAAWEDSPRKLHMIRDADWLASAMYFLSGVIESSCEVARGDSKLLVMDRSLWSTLAVHYAHEPARLATLLPLFELAADRLAVPNLTIVLEADAETCRQRIARKSDAEQTFDAASPSDDAFHLREREFYHWLSAQGPKVVFLDANQAPPEELCQRAAELISGLLPCCC